MKDVDQLKALLAFIAFELGLLVGISWSVVANEAYAVEIGEFAVVSDIMMEREPDCPGSHIRCLGPITEEVDWCYEEECYEQPDSYYESDGFMQEGIRAGVDSVTETWYSSNVAYHYRTGEWSPDSEGYYRDSDGYYVVASNDYPNGSVVETSKGQAKVYDDGTESGNVDFYVGW